MTVALLGPSLMEPDLPGTASQPPWSVTAHPPAGLTVALSGAAIVAAGAGLILSMNAIRRGWSIPARPILLAGIAGAFVLAFLPPFGSSDHLSYAAYGRMAITGHNPFTTTPAHLARLGDPVARAVQDWRTSPSVYGSLGVGVQAFAAWVGGTSVRLIVFVLSLVNVLAFALTGLMLHWLGRRDAGRQLRAAVLWTANPLMLMILVAGAHIDTQAIVFGVAAVTLATGISLAGVRRAVVTGAGVGALVGLGFAIKVTTALVGAGIAVGLMLAWRRLAASRALAGVIAGLAAGFCVAVLAALIPWGTGMFGPALHAGSFTSIGSPWRAARSGLRALIGENVAEDVIKVGAVVLAVLLVVLLLRHLRADGEQLLAACAFVFVFAWLLAWPYVLPWYDGLGWALIAVLPASRLDWLMLARTMALAIGYLPARGLPLPAGLGWLESVVRTAITPAALLVVLVLAIVWLWRGDRIKLVAA
ncbi:MAG TPA: hypothetical protein VN695_13120 [Streptosporangiaceae bacterium]|nr:hypothetical protein [Streptosporangiaceae bacterium]